MCFPFIQSSHHLTWFLIPWKSNPNLIEKINAQLWRKIQIYCTFLKWLLHIFGEKIMFKDDKFIWWEKSCYTNFFKIFKYRIMLNEDLRIMLGEDFHIFFCFFFFQGTCHQHTNRSGRKFWLHISWSLWRGWGRRTPWDSGAT